MTTGTAARVRGAAAGQVASSLAFDWWMAILPGWVLIGLYVDGWAHAHLPSTLETFFTPWHALLYSGMLVSLVVLAIQLVRNHQNGYSWAGALPAGYELSLGGAILFGVGGFLDMLWHITFGIEVSTEALLSPTHLILAISGFLLMAGPIRAYQRRKEAPARWREWLPLLLSLLWILALLGFFTQYANPVRTPWAANSQHVVEDRYGWVMGIDEFLVQSVLLAGIVLFALRRWPGLPIGALTLLFTCNALLASTQGEQFRFIMAGLAAGITSDALLWWLRQSGGGGLPLRVFAFGVPALASLFYFLVVLATGGTWWRIHLVGGSIAISGLIGWLISYLVFPMPGPGEQAEIL